MNILTLNCGLNQFANINEKVFFDLINQVSKKYKSIKILNDSKIIFSDDQNNISIKLNIKIKASKKISLEIIEDFQNDIENLINSTIGIKPTNIQICYLGLA